MRWSSSIIFRVSSFRYHSNVATIRIHHEYLKPPSTLYVFKTWSDKRDSRSILGPSGLTRSDSCQPGDIRAVPTHQINLSLATAVARKDDSSVWHPFGRGFIKRWICGQP